MERLKRIYYDVGKPGSFGGVKRLSEASGVSIPKVREWLSQQDTYSLHKPVRHKFSRRKTIASGVNELWQSDLLDLQKRTRHNRGYRYLLTIIDVMSRYLRVIPVKSKKANVIADAFKKVFKQAKPRLLLTDLGKEFYNGPMRALFKKYGIHHYSTKSGQKCAILERAHRTLRNALYRVFTFRNSYKYHDILKSVVEAYNNSVHSSHGLIPSKITQKDEPFLYERLYNYEPVKKFRFAVNDTVRISKLPKTFQKASLPGWSEEIFKIHRRYPTSPQTYTLVDLNDKEIEGRFYKEELQKVDKSYWAIEKIIRTKGKGKNKQLFVKWTGLPSTHNSWIQASWIQP